MRNSLLRNTKGHKLSKNTVTTKVVVRETIAEIKAETKIVSLDETNARDLLEKFEANKVNKATLEAEYKTLQAEIYALLGYKKVGEKWIGIAEEGTIEGVSVVKVGTQARQNFNKEKFLQENPHLLEIVESFTETNTHTVLKTVR
jgi:hypothetical protein